MGFNTSVLILNDALHSLDDDLEFGPRLKRAIQEVWGRTASIDVRIGNHVNACQVIETHHADHYVPVLIGGNCGIPILGTYLSWATKEPELKLLEELARKLGYDLHKKPRKRSPKADPHLVEQLTESVEIVKRQKEK